MLSSQSSMSSLKSHTSFFTFNTTESSPTLFTTVTLLPTPSTSTSWTKKAWKTIKRYAKSHHESVNAAYSVYYGRGHGHMARRTDSVKFIGYPDNSKVKFTEGHKMERNREESKAKKAWDKVKIKAKVHNGGSNPGFNVCFVGTVGLRIGGE